MMATVTLDQFHRNIREMVRTGEMGRALHRAASQSAGEMVGNTQDNYLRGPRPAFLGRVSGALARSVRFKTTPRNNGITVNLMAGGGPESVDYARVHELGDNRTITVKQHTRTMVFGKTVAPFSVGPYGRKQNVRARPYLKPSRNEILRERVPAIFTEEIRETMQRLFTGG